MTTYEFLKLEWAAPRYKVPTLLEHFPCHDIIVVSRGDGTVAVYDTEQIECSRWTTLTSFIKSTGMNNEEFHAMYYSEDDLATHLGSHRVFIGEH